MKGHPTDASRLTVQNTGQEDVAVYGGNSDDMFIVEAVHLVGGFLELFGGAGVNSVEFTHDAKFGRNITFSGTSMFVQGMDPILFFFVDLAGGATEHIVKWSALQRRNVTILGDGITHFHLVHPAANSLHQVFSVGTPQTTINHRISGCDLDADVR